MIQRLITHQSDDASAIVRRSARAQGNSNSQSSNSKFSKKMSSSIAADLNYHRNSHSEIGFVVLLDERVDLLGDVRTRVHLAREVVAKRNLHRISPLLVIPQLRSAKGLCAVKETFTNRH